MHIAVCTQAYNEAKILPYFLRHYLPLANAGLRVYVDPDTNDDTVSMLEKTSGVAILGLPPFKLDDLKFVGWARNEINKISADIILWVDPDEFIVAPEGDLRSILEEDKLAGHALVKPSEGWQMISREFPETYRQIYTVVKTGFPASNYAKPVIVNSANANFQWAAGKHSVIPSELVHEDSRLKLLHMRYLGLEYHQNRNRVNWSRLEAMNRALGHAHEQAPEHENSTEAGFNERLGRAIPVPGLK